MELEHWETGQKEVIVLEEGCAACSVSDPDLCHVCQMLSFTLPEAIMDALNQHFPCSVGSECQSHCPRCLLNA